MILCCFFQRRVPPRCFQGILARYFTPIFGRMQCFISLLDSARAHSRFRSRLIHFECQFSEEILPSPSYLYIRYIYQEHLASPSCDWATSKRDGFRTFILYASDRNWLELLFDNTTRKMFYVIGADVLAKMFEGSRISGSFDSQQRIILLTTTRLFWLVERCFEAVFRPDPSVVSGLAHSFVPALLELLRCCCEIRKSRQSQYPVLTAPYNGYIPLGCYVFSGGS